MYIKEIVGLFSSFKYVPSPDPGSIFLTSSHESSRMVGLGLTSTFCLPYSDHLFIHTLSRDTRGVRRKVIKLCKVGGLITLSRIARPNMVCS